VKTFTSLRKPTSGRLIALGYHKAQISLGKRIGRHNRDKNAQGPRRENLSHESTITLRFGDICQIQVFACRKKVVIITSYFEKA